MSKEGNSFMKHHETICIKVYAYVCVTHTHIYTHMYVNKMIMIRLFATITAAADAQIVWTPCNSFWLRPGRHHQLSPARVPQPHALPRILRCENNRWVLQERLGMQKGRIAWVEQCLGPLIVRWAEDKTDFAEPRLQATIFHWAFQWLPCCKPNVAPPILLVYTIHINPCISGHQFHFLPCCFCRWVFTPITSHSFLHTCYPAFIPIIFHKKRE